jgi:hypothetical protein
MGDFARPVCRAFRCRASLGVEAELERMLHADDPLTSPELIDGYLDEAIATGNPAVIRLGARPDRAL